MTKQEEIRKWLKEELEEWGIYDVKETPQQDNTYAVDKILNYLHSQGVVISNGGTCAIGDLAVEPLIKEG